MLRSSSSSSNAVPRAPPASRHLPPSCTQVFIATSTCQTQPAYGRAMAALLENLDAFTTTATMAQALPALHGRSYLDIATMSCREELGRSRSSHGEPEAVGGWADATMAVAYVCCGGFLPTDTLTPVSPEPLPDSLGNMTVRLVVECPEPRCPQGRLYDQPVPAPAGASLLDVLRVAAAQEPPDFTYVASPAGAGGPSRVPACHTWGGQVSHTCATGSPMVAGPGLDPHPAVPPAGSIPKTPPRAPS